MNHEKIKSLKKRVAERREAASQKFKESVADRASLAGHKAPPKPLATLDRASLQAASAMFGAPTDTDPIGAQSVYGADTEKTVKRPAAPTGQWRCVVNSNVVSIDLIANISENGELSGQGTIVYVATNRIYQVSGKGDWMALPPDPNTTDWLFKFRLQPSNHPIFSWFASPTESPNHMQNRFVIPNGGGVVETNCERTG